jgi:hypothetical protein
MKEQLVWTVAVVGLLALQGCAGSRVESYKLVDLGKDLDSAVVARYENEAARAAQDALYHHVTLLETSKGWPLGLIAYWRQGRVQVLHQADGSVVYAVTQRRGCVIRWRSHTCPKRQRCSTRRGGGFTACPRDRSCGGTWPCSTTWASGLTTGRGTVITPRASCTTLSTWATSMGSIQFRS